MYQGDKFLLERPSDLDDKTYILVSNTEAMHRGQEPGHPHAN